MVPAIGRPVNHFGGRDAYDTSTMAADLPRIDLSSRETLTMEIARRLLDYFLSGQVEPGERIPSERRLAEALGVGRSLVREALKSLHLLGLLEVRQGDGTYLKRTDSELLPQVIEWGLLLGERPALDLVEAREHLEVVVAGLAAERRDAQALDDLRQLLATMRESSDDPVQFVEADVGFHLRVAEAAGNVVLSDMLSGVRALLRVWIRRVIEAAGETGPSYREHLPIFEAIERGDRAAATAAMAAHMEGASARLKATISQSAWSRRPAREG
jgi:GntR family transcriptional regulator, transcriptional repressor for pyruvate dehydrogenase complex